MTSPVSVVPWRSDLGAVLLPMLLWVLVFGGRLVCKGCQRAVPLTTFWVPLPLEDTVRLQHHRPR
jgi:hypothetical protein